MADQRKPLTDDEMILKTLSAEVRTIAAKIIEHAQGMIVGNMNATARETAQAINQRAGRLSALVHQRELTLARVMRDRGTPITFTGPAIRWCNAMVPGTGLMHGFVVGCNRMLRDDGSCRHQGEHIPATKLENAADCPGAVFDPRSMICLTCGHPAEQHSDAADLGDTLREFTAPEFIVTDTKAAVVPKASGAYRYAPADCPGFILAGQHARWCARCGVREHPEVVNVHEGPADDGRCACGDDPGHAGACA